MKALGSKRGLGGGRMAVVATKFVKCGHERIGAVGRGAFEEPPLLRVELDVLEPKEKFCGFGPFVEHRPEGSSPEIAGEAV